MNRGIKILQTFALPLGYGALLIVTDYPPPVWQPPIKNNGAEDGIRTRDFDLGKVALYH